MSASFVLLLAVNLLPVAGVLWGSWDAFVVLILYWLETLVIGFWTMIQVALEPRRAPSVPARLGGVLKALVLSINAAIFMTAHFLFLWAMFAGDWRDRITDAPSFIDQLVIGTGVWLPLALLFTVRGALTLSGLLIPALAARLGVTPESGSARPLRAFYARIVTMHLTIIAGGWIVMMLGSQKALVAVVAIKIVLDMLLDPLMKSGRGAPGAGVGAPAR